MKRREFVAGLIGYGAASPSILCAQQSTMPVVALIHSSTFAEFDHMIGAFHKGLAEAGFLPGRNVIVEHHSGEGQPEGLDRLISNLTNRPVNSIVANGVAALAAKAATTTIP